MADNNSSKFKIRFDDDNNGSQYENDSAAPAAEEVEMLQLKKLRRRINRVAFLIPLLLALILLFAYLDVRKRLDDTRNSGAPNAMSLSKDLDSKFSSLSIRQAKLEALLDQKIAAMQQTAARLEKELDQTEKTLAGVRSATPDKQDMAGIVVAELEKRLAPVGADLQKLSSELKKMSSEENALKNQFEKRFNGLTSSLKDLSAAFGTLEKKSETLRQDTAGLASGKVDKRSFDLAIRHEEKFYQQKLDDLEKSLAQKIQDVRDQLGTLLEIQKSRSVESPVPNSSRGSVNTPPPEETAKPAPAEPGHIVEQDIRK